MPVFENVIEYLCERGHELYFYTLRDYIIGGHKVSCAHIIINSNDIKPVTLFALFNEWQCRIVKLAVFKNKYSIIFGFFMTEKEVEELKNKENKEIKKEKKSEPTKKTSI